MPLGPMKTPYISSLPGESNEIVVPFWAEPRYFLLYIRSSIANCLSQTQALAFLWLIILERFIVASASTPRQRPSLLITAAIPSEEGALSGPLRGPAGILPLTHPRVNRPRRE